MKNSRRTFLKNSAIAMAGAGLYPAVSTKLFGAGAPSNRLQIGVIGTRFGVVNMRSMMDGSPWVDCAALCDVDRNRLEDRAGELKKDYPENTRNMKLYGDFRELLNDRNIDGVIIATPDHWHTYMYAEASKAGMAIFIEKPTGHTVRDCELMIELQRKHQNVVTTGLWQISLNYFVEAFDIIRSGVLGDVYKVHAWITGGTQPVTFQYPQSVPDGLDYDMWQGPAPKHPYAAERVRRWSRFWDYAGGQQANWVHYLDSAFDGIVALGHDLTYPKSVYSTGYKHPDTMYEVPSVQTSVFEFEDYHVVWEHQVTDLYNRGDGVAWIGSNGTLICNRTGFEVIPETSNGQPVIAEKRMQGSYGNQYAHMINWAECIRDNNTETNSPVAKGSYATILANIANISYRTGSQRLEYLPDEKKFVDNPQADEYLVNEYHNGWEYPQL